MERWAYPLWAVSTSRRKSAGRTVRLSDNARSCPGHVSAGRRSNERSMNIAAARPRTAAGSDQSSARRRLNRGMRRLARYAFDQEHFGARALLAKRLGRRVLRRGPPGAGLLDAREL